MSLFDKSDTFNNLLSNLYITNTNKLSESKFRLNNLLLKLMRDFPQYIAVSRANNNYIISVHPPNSSVNLQDIKFFPKDITNKTVQNVIDSVNQHKNTIQKHPIIGMKKKKIYTRKDFQKQMREIKKVDVIPELLYNSQKNIAGQRSIHKYNIQSVIYKKQLLKSKKYTDANVKVNQLNSKLHRDNFYSQFAVISSKNAAIQIDALEAKYKNGVRTRNGPILPVSLPPSVINSLGSLGNALETCATTVQQAVGQIQLLETEYAAGNATIAEISSTIQTAGSTLTSATDAAAAIANNAAASSSAADVALSATIAADDAAITTVLVSEAGNEAAIATFEVSTALADLAAGRAVTAIVAAAHRAVSVVRAAQVAVAIAAEATATGTGVATGIETIAVIAGGIGSGIGVILVIAGIGALAAIVSERPAYAGQIGGINTGVYGSGGGNGIGGNGGVVGGNGSVGSIGGGIGSSGSGSTGSGGSSGSGSGSGGTGGGNAGDFGGNPGAGQGGSSGGSGGSGSSGGSGGSTNGSNNTNACTTSITYDENGEILEIDICLSEGSSSSSNPYGDDGIPAFLPGDPLTPGMINGGGGTINPSNGVGGTDPTDNDGTQIGPQVPGSGGGNPSAPTGGGGDGNNPDGNSGTSFGIDIKGPGSGDINGGPRPLEPDDYYRTLLGNTQIVSFLQDGNRTINTKDNIINIISRSLALSYEQQIMNGSYKNSMRNWGKQFVDILVKELNTGQNMYVDFDKYTFDNTYINDISHFTDLNNMNTTNYTNNIVFIPDNDNSIVVQNANTDDVNIVSVISSYMMKGITFYGLFNIVKYVLKHYTSIKNNVNNILYMRK
jgi:hypothetical protein